ncbi:MAG: AsmA family protein, partial [Burkholderiales bacterium]|nr:AsmA family protein [Burkholderiales bacterium]
SRGELDLAALFVQEIRIARAHAADVRLRLDAAAFAAVAAAHERVTREARPQAPDGWRFVEIARAEVSGARGEIRLPALPRPLAIEVATLNVDAAESTPLRMQASGSLAAEDVQVAFVTAPLGALRGGVRAIPLDLRFTLPDASLRGHGTLELTTQRGDYRIEGQGAGRVIERLLPGFQGALGDLKALSVEARLRTAPGETSLESVQLAAGRTQLRGRLRQREVNGRSSFEGRLEIETLDLRPWLPLLDAQAGTAAPQANPLERLRAIQGMTDVDLALAIGQLIWPQRVAHGLDASLALNADALALRGSARLPAGALEASLKLDTTQPEARLRLHAQGREVVLEALHPMVEQAGISGTVREAKLALRGAGADPAAIVRALEGELDLRAADARWRRDAEGAATQVRIETAQLAATREALRGTFNAALDDATLVLKLESARAAIEPARRVLDSTFELSVRRAHQHRMHLAAQGQVKLDPESWSLDVHEARLGRSHGRMTASGAWAKETPLALSASLTHFDSAALEFFEFESMKRRAKPPPWEARPVLPSGLALPPADFELHATRFEAGTAQFDGLRLAGRSRGGRLERTEFELEAKGGVLKGELSADLRGKLPQLQARFAGTDFDLRPLAERFDLRIERARAQRLDAKLDMSGARLKEVLAHSTIELSARGLGLALSEPNVAGGRLAFEGTLDAGSDKGQLRVSADGTLNGKALRATSRGPQLATLMDRAERVPVDIALHVADSALAVRGTVAKGPAADLHLQLDAKRTDDLLALGGVRAQLPGVLAARAQLTLTPPARYAFEALELKLGESMLGGRVVADWSAARPRIDATLAGPVLRLRDLGIDASAVTSNAPAKPGAQAPDVPAWLEPMRSIDAAVDLKVDRLSAAGDELGSLQLAARLEDGRLNVAPFTITEGASTLRGEAEVDAKPAMPVYALHAELRDYDVTPLVRSFEPRSTGTATFDARAALRSRGTGAAVVENLSGAFDVASYAVGVGSGSIQMLGIDLLGLVVRTLDKSRGSKINCVVGVFDVDKGVMKSRALFVDTTRLRIMGNLDVDLAARTLDGGLRPRPKQPRLFSVSTPVDISGTFDRPKVSLATSALPELIARYWNPYTIFLGSLMDATSAEADGSGDCRAAYARAEAARPELGNELRRVFRFLP